LQEIFVPHTTPTGDGHIVGSGSGLITGGSAAANHEASQLVGRVFELFFLAGLIRCIAGGIESLILSQLFQSSQEHTTFINGFFEGEGCFSLPKRRVIQGVETSIDLAAHVQAIEVVVVHSSQLLPNV
jgi:hypothetical protein